MTSSADVPDDQFAHVVTSDSNDSVAPEGGIAAATANGRK